jgi:DNA-binding beta-propeller fold protein YncE
LYFADSETSAIRYATLDPSGNIETIVGQDLFVFGDVDGYPEDCRLQHPLGITYRGKALYIADTYNHKIKCINLETRITSTIFGSGKSGDKDGVGTDAEFSEPSGLSITGGYLYIADTNNHIIRKANLSTYQVITMNIQRP